MQIAPYWPFFNRILEGDGAICIVVYRSEMCLSGGENKKICHCECFRSDEVD